MTLTAEFGDGAYPPRYSNPKVKDRQPSTSQHDEETTASLQVTPPARRIRTDKHLPGFEFQAELQKAVKPLTDTITALDVLKDDSAFREIKILDDEIRRACWPLDEVDRAMKSSAVYQINKFLDNWNRPFH